MSRRTTLLLGALALFAAIEALLFAVDDPRQGVSVLFVIPIALLALRDGQRGGLAAALIATAGFAVWVALSDTGLTALGWLSRLVAFFLLGVLLGRFQDVIQSRERRRLEARHAHEVQDEIVQALVVARYQLHAEGPEIAEQALDEALSAAKEIVTRALPDGDLEPGDLRLADR